MIQPTGTSDAAFLALLERLRETGYRFVTPTPDTHRRVLRRPFEGAPGVRDVLGWSRTFHAEDLDPQILGLMDAAGLLEPQPSGRLKSRLRVATLGDDLLFHSAHPTTGDRAVFLGPDTYRFAAFLEAELSAGPEVERLVDVGTGAGAGALAAGRLLPGARLILTDLNPDALRLARINLTAAGMGGRAFPVEASGLTALADASVDLVIANPPYIGGGVGRLYRDGGADLGTAVAADWARQAMAALRPGGRLLLYSGAPIVDGEDQLLKALVPALADTAAAVDRRELDPDVFGGMLSHPAYRQVERIAAVGVRVVRA